MPDSLPDSVVDRILAFAGAPMESGVGKPCYNKYCGKIMDASDAAYPDTPHPMWFGKSHLCTQCKDKFEGQKMRGRWRFLGEAISAVEPYTESIDEWISWQALKEDGK